MPFWNLFRRKKVDTELDRFERLMRTGRVTEGRIIDSDGATLEDITRIFYVYNVAGSDYESSHHLTEAQRQNLAKYAPGARVSVRYDYHQPGNSIVV